jgi:hypothetical protein
MKTHSRRIVTAALLAAMALGGTVALAGEGGGGQASAARAKLKAEWAEARARKAASPNASFVERLFGLDGKATTDGAAPAAMRAKKS